MTSFIICATLITIATLVLLIWPLKRTRNTISYERHAQNIHFARERLEELEEQLQNAAISAADYEALKSEIESTLAHDLDISNKDEHYQQESPRASNKIAISLLLISIPLSAIGFYLMTGTPEAMVAKKAEQRLTNDEINTAIAGIEQRLIQNPDDLEGWSVISSTYFALGRYDDAEKAYKNILRLDGESDTVYAALADASGLKSKGEITNTALNYALKSLSLNASNRQALWLAGLGSAQRGNMSAARDYWGRLVPLLDSVPQQQQELSDIIAQSYQETGPSAPGKDAPSAYGINVNISISPSMANQFNPDDTVFVFAKAKKGPPAPLAAKKLSVSDLPASVVLSESDAMIAQLSIAQFEDLLVSARISKSGQPIPQPGDLESASIETKNNARQPINLVISQVIE